MGARLLRVPGVRRCDVALWRGSDESYDDWGHGTYLHVGPRSNRDKGSGSLHDPFTSTHRQDGARASHHHIDHRVPLMG